jgi:acetamidase/formamidase
MTVYHFQPASYQNTFATREPVLKISPGDTVITSTIDAWGYDSKGSQAAQRPNPQTGPFYIEGAEPGDVLKITLDALEPNRQTGFSNSSLAYNVVEPSQVLGLPQNQHVTWQLDHVSMTASLQTQLDGGRGLSFPMHPMLGCLGVAPPIGQAISASTSGQHGGNMDYKGVVADVTLYFPIFAQGALFQLGDGHAVQGDGEILGTGIETSFDVTFTVQLIKKKIIHWPRGESADCLFTMGNARPLDQALQHATGEMLHWLRTDYQLSPEKACLIMGMAVEYEVGNVYDPAYTMVCKVPRKVLQEIV